MQQIETVDPAAEQAAFVAEALTADEQSREQVERLERYLLMLPQLDGQTTHALAGGLYARTMVMPAGSIVTGAIHRRDHLCIVSGDVSVGRQRYTGHHVIVGRAGAKRALVAHAETTWTTICRTDETDLARIEADLVEEPERLQTRSPAIGCAPVQTLTLED